jgi:alkylation response protein AidB-like acyl-CoA dehydrogenase
MLHDRAGSLDDELAWSMALKASAGRAYETTARDAVQVCGAMGLTWEHPLPGYVRRGAVLNGLLGDASELTSVLGAMILRGENLPTFDPFES